MRSQFHVAVGWIVLALVLVLAGMACARLQDQPVPTPTPPRSAPPEPTTPATPSPTHASEPTTAPTTAATATHDHAEPEEGVLYTDSFTERTGGWPDALEFGNYYIGYHEPEFYHVEVHEQNDSAVVALPEQTFEDVTVEAKVFADQANTAPEGDFRYGLVLRRTGNQYYAFLVSPRSQRWWVLKSAPGGVTVLDEGTDESIQGIDAADELRVDAAGSTLVLHVNGQSVTEVSDDEYTDGELGFIVETFDAPRAHIHYDSLTVREAEPASVDEAVLYTDSFTERIGGWPDALEFGNYYIGYHEPEFYHVEVHEQNDSAVVALPEQTFEDVTVEAELFADRANTAPEGDFRYGLVLRRTGRDYYAFMLSPRSQRWWVLKSAASGVTVLDEGTDESIQGIDAADELQVDVAGSILTFHVNGWPVTEVSDDEYTGGELGFIVETFDAPRAHIHYDSLTVRQVELPTDTSTPSPNQVRSTYYDGSDAAHVRYDHQPQFDIGIPMTIEAWVYRRDGRRCETILSHDWTTSYWFGFCPALRFYRSGRIRADATGDVPVGRWVHVAASYDGTTVRFYVDGEPAGSEQLANAGANVIRPLTLGGAPGGYHFRGYLDEVRLWSVARTQQQIQDGMFVEIHTDPDLQAVFPHGGRKEALSGVNGDVGSNTRESVFGMLPR